MLAQIEQSFAAREPSEERMRQFVADASHELRTPLAAVRGYAELYRQGAVREPADVASAMSRIEGEAARMGGLVEDLLMLARLDDERPLRVRRRRPHGARRPTPPRTPAPSTPDRAHHRDRPRRTAGPGRRPRRRAPAAPGPRQPLSNALNHTPTGTPVEIAVGTRDSDGPPSSRCATTAPGIDPDKATQGVRAVLPRRPVRSVRGTGGGNGLGLAIAAAIVSAHHGPDRRRPDARRRRDVRRGAAHSKLPGSAQHPLTLGRLTGVTKPPRGARQP